jgi:hypothetical protein
MSKFSEEKLYQHSQKPKSAVLLFIADELVVSSKPENVELPSPLTNNVLVVVRPGV